MAAVAVSALVIEAIQATVSTVMSGDSPRARLPKAAS
jgi:hypothetical protein